MITTVRLTSPSITLQGYLFVMGATQDVSSPGIVQLNNMVDQSQAVRSIPRSHSHSTEVHTLWPTPPRSLPIPRPRSASMNPAFTFHT